MSVAQPLPIGFVSFFFGNFRPWLRQDYLYYSIEVANQQNITKSRIHQILAQKPLPLADHDHHVHHLGNSPAFKKSLSVPLLFTQPALRNRTNTVIRLSQQRFQQGPNHCMANSAESQQDIGRLLAVQDCLKMKRLQTMSNKNDLAIPTQHPATPHSRLFPL